MKKETEVSLTTQEEGDMSVTTQLSPTVYQDVTAKHESLVLIAGESVSFHCTSSVKKPFRWNYWSLASRQSTLIYNGVRVNNEFRLANRVVVSSCGTRNCTLMFVDLQPYDTGSLACSRGTDKKYWSFTILG